MASQDLAKLGNLSSLRRSRRLAKGAGVPVDTTWPVYSGNDRS